MTTDMMDRLRELAPANSALEQQFPADERAALAQRILQQGPSAVLQHRPVRRRRRRLVLASLAAAASIAVVPTVLPSGAPGGASPAAAEALRHLADVAAATPADQLAPGQFVHVVSQSHQVGIPENPTDGDVVLDSTTETWTAYDGAQWSRSSGGDVTVTPADDTLGGVDYFASLPTDPDELAQQLRRQAHGSSSKDEAVFLLLGDVLGSPTAPSAVRAAAASAMAQSEHVRLGTTVVDSLGRPVTEFEFVDESARPGVVQAILVDMDTAAVIGRRERQPGGSYLAAEVSSGVVDSVPREVLQSACPVNGPICS